MAKQRQPNSQPDRPRARVLGVPIDAVNLNRAVEIVENAIKAGRRGYVCVTGVHGVMEAQRDIKLRAAIEQALMVTPDGMPTVWLGRRQGHRGMQRVFGPDLVSAMLARSAGEGHTHFFYGGKPGVAEELRLRMTKKYPGVKIVGTFTPPFRPLDREERLALRNMLDQLRPDVVWVGLSTPKQELFMAESLDQLGVGMMIGVGAAFDFLSGNLKDAPTWVKSAGLQWFHRLVQEPKRLWRRYLINNSLFVLYLILEKLGYRETVPPVRERLEFID